MSGGGCTNKGREGWMVEDGEPGCRWISGAQRQTWGEPPGRGLHSSVSPPTERAFTQSISPFDGPFLSHCESEFTKAGAIVIFLHFLFDNYGREAGRAKGQKKNAKVTQKVKSISQDRRLNKRGNEYWRKLVFPLMDLSSFTKLRLNGEDTAVQTDNFFMVGIKMNYAQG